MAARATPATSRAGGVAADDLGHRLAPRFEPLAVEGIGDRGDVSIKTPLRDQRACQHSEERKGEQARQKRQKRVLQDEGRQNGGYQQGGKREQAVEPPPGLGHARLVQTRLQAVEQRAHPHDRMADAGEESGRIAERCLDESRAEDGDEIERHAHGSA